MTTVGVKGLMSHSSIWEMIFPADDLADANKTKHNNDQE